MFFKAIIYGIYMIGLRMKGIKYYYLKKFKSEKAAEEFVEKVILKWSDFTINIIGIEIEVRGKENIPKEPCVFISNHTSILDIPILFKTVNKPLGFIAKKEMLKVPVIGFWLEKVHCVPLDRNNTREAIKSINDGVNNISKGICMAIFPEGTRSKDGQVGEFKKGSFKLATKAKVKVVPVSINGADKSFEAERRFKPSKVQITFGKAVDTSKLSKEETVALIENTRNEIINNLKIKDA